MPEGPLRTPSAEELAASVAERARRVLAAADRTAQESEKQAAQRIAQAEREAAAYLEAAQQRIDAFAEGRVRRMREAGDALLAGAEDLAQRLAHTERLTAGIDEVVDALGAAAEAIAAEATRAPIRLPRIEGGMDAMAPSPLEEQPAPVAQRPPGDGAADHVRDAAANLPPRPRGRA